MAYTLDKFTQARDKAHAQGRQMTQEEFAGIGGAAADFPLVYGGATGGPGQQGAQQPQQPQQQSFGGPAQYGGGLSTGGGAQAPQFGATGVQQQGGGYTPQAVPGQAGGQATTRGSFGTPQAQSSTVAPQQGQAQPQPQRQSIGGLPNPQTNAQNAIGAQFGLNQINIGQQQALNRVNEVNPYGSAQYVQNPDGSITRQYNLSAPQQALLNQQQSRDIALGDTAADSFYQMRNEYGQPLSLDQLGQAPELSFNDLPQLLGANDMQGQRQSTEDAVYDSFARRNEPNFEREQEALEQSLSERGIPRDSERARIELENMRQRQEDARLNAQNSARVAGLQELQGLFGLSREARSQLAGEQQTLFSAGGQQRDRALNEMLLQRDRPASELSTLLGLQKGVTNPEFAPISNINVPQIDAIGAGLGFRGDETNRYLGQLQAETAKANAAAANALGYAQLSSLDKHRQNQFQLDQQTLAQNQAQFDDQYGNQPGFEDALIDGGVTAVTDAAGNWLSGINWGDLWGSGA